LAGGHAEAVIIPMLHTATIHGRLVFPSGEEPNPQCFFGGFRLEPLDRVLTTSVFGAHISEKDGTFTADSIPQGRYRVSRRVGDCAAVNPEQVISIQTIDVNLNPVITSNMASVSGTAPPNSYVVMASQQASGAIDLTEWEGVAADASGHYRFGHVGLGKHRLMALPSRATHNYEEPAFWLDHKSQTVLVNLTPGSAVRANLRLLKPIEAWQ
jgi:hypothetical protein